MGTQPGSDCLTPKVDLFVDAYEEALATLSREAEEHPGFADAQHRLGLLYYLAGLPEQAVEHHQRALAINPQYAAARSALGYALEASGDPAAALAAWQQGATEAAGSEHPGTALDLAMAAGRRGAAPRGVQGLEMAGAGGWYRDLLARERCLLFYQAGEEEAAEAALLALRARSEHFARHFAEQGLVVHGEARAERVPSYLEEREANYNLGEIHAYLGEIYAAFGAFSKAAAELRRALVVSFDLPSFHVRSGRLQRLAGHEQRAAEAFRRAVTDDPEHVGARIELGHELAALGEHRAAVAQLEAAAGLEPGYADVHYKLGLLHLQLGRLEDARAALERALEINPRFAMAQASLALVHMRTGDDEAALDAFHRTLEFGLESADLFLNMALIHIRREQPERALAYLRRGTRVGPRYAPLYYHLGRLYRELGRKQEAQQAWRRFFTCADELEFAERLELFHDDLRTPLAAAQG